jgi:hypothetical protein
VAARSVATNTVATGFVEPTVPVGPRLERRFRVRSGCAVKIGPIVVRGH